MENSTATTVRYSQKSKFLWEFSPVCEEYQQGNTFGYTSTYTNGLQDPVFYKTKQGPNQVKPNEGLEGPGFFSAYPGGLHIDPQTGEIDINESEAGIRYAVEFTPCGRDCAARTNVVISGIGYEGGIFSLSSRRDLVLKPFYFGSTSPEEEIPSKRVPSRKAPSGDYGINPNPRKKPTADLLGLALDCQTGKIDLRRTIREGGLGFRRNADGSCGELPENGASKEFTIYYRLNKTPAGDVINRTKVRLHFYDTLRDVPEELRVRVRQQNNSIYRQGWPLLLGMPLPYSLLPDTPLDMLAALLASLSSFLFLMPKAKESNNPMIPPEAIILA